MMKFDKTAKIALAAGAAIVGVLGFVGAMNKVGNDWREKAVVAANTAISQCVRIHELTPDRQSYCDVIDPAKANVAVAEYIASEKFAAYKRQVEAAYEVETEARVEEQRAANQLDLENKARGVLRRAEEYNHRVYKEECERGVRSVYECVR